MYPNFNDHDLPNSSALGSEIIPDDIPLAEENTNVQDYVRELLRNDIHAGSSMQQPWTPVGSQVQSQRAPRVASNNGLPTPPDSPVHHHPNHHQQHADTTAPPAAAAMPIPSPPASAHGNPTGQMYAAYQQTHYPTMMSPPPLPRQPAAVRQSPVVRSTTSNGVAAAPQVSFSTNGNRNNNTNGDNSNSRALVGPFNHPDLSEPPMSAFQQTKIETQHQQQQERRHGHQHRTSTAIQREREIRHRKQLAADRATSSSCLVCGLSALLLAAIVATCRSLKRGVSGLFSSSPSSASSVASSRSSSSFSFSSLFRRCRKSSE